MKYVISCLIFALPISIYGQKSLSEIRTYDDVLQIYLRGEENRFPHGGLDGNFTADITIPTVDTISLVSEIDSVAFIVKPSDTINFNVIRLDSEDTLKCRFAFKQEIRYASFTDEFKRANDGKRIVEVPKVYELVNIIFSLTQASIKDNGLVRSNTEHYDAVKSYFDTYSDHKVVKTFDSLLAGGKYHNLKLDAYGFEFNKTGEIIESPIYHIISWEDSNSIAPYLDELNDFANKSRFLEFYAKRQEYYQSQYRTFIDTLDVDGMITWLKRNFPRTSYNSYKIIYSPLVNSNQSSWWYENNNFKELQAHVNYPYITSYYLDYTPEIMNVMRGEIVFTELNHGFINPETTRNNYGQIFQEIFKDMSVWTDATKPAGYYQNPFSCFNEYLNWGLVSLRYYDTVPEAVLKELLQKVETMMVQDRGFKKFDRFNQFLLGIYKNKERDQTIADLYPLIVTWFQINKN